MWSRPRSRNSPRGYATGTDAGNSGLQYLGDGNWQYNWATSKTYAGLCRTMSLNLKDGTVHTADFIFNKRGE